MHSDHKRYHGLGMDALVTVCTRNATASTVGHGCTRDRMHSEHERFDGLGTDALATVCTRNTTAITVWA